MERKLKLDGSPSGSVANQETSKPSMGKGKGNEGKKMKKNVRFNLPASDLKPSMEKRDQVDEDSSKAKKVEKMGGGSRSRSSSKDRTPTLIFSKRLTFGDLLTGKLRVPSLVFLPKKHEGKHGRMMVPFVDSKGEFWELEATPQWFSLNLDKFVKAHGLKCDDVILFYEDGPNSRVCQVGFTGAFGLMRKCHGEGWAVGEGEPWVRRVEMDDGEGNVLEALVLGIRWMPVRMGCDPTVSFSSPKMTPLPKIYVVIAYRDVKDVI
ncbi:hypothetical protein CK203_085171 [Vitis vinifera]|uniref:B3 domain-containing protein n=1 Tax=Vitis vinifera TaxID=29760 RepID=A0A438E0R3_VITVI|nr:hypothetical protein CK203_085171 [Vitis vinifera]